MIVCTECGGDTICPYCTNNEDSVENCLECGGSGECAACDGNGEVEGDEDETP